MTSVQGCTLVNRLLQKAHGGAIYRVPWNRNKSSKCKAFIRLCGVGAGLKLLIMQGYFFNEYNQYYYPDKTVRVINVNHLFNCVFTLSLFSHFSDIFRSFVQFYNLIPNLSIEKNISLPLVLDKQKVDTAKLEALAERLGIKNKLHNFPHELSGGQQQRSAIARSLIYAPALLAFTPANPVVKTLALGDAFKDGTKANVAFVFANKWKGYQTVKDLASLIEPETEDYRTVFFVNDSLLAMYGAFDREDASRENVLTMTLFPLSLAVGAILVFVLMLKNIYSIWACDKIRALAMYKSIGCSRRQLKKIVVKEALRQALPAALFSLIPGNILSYLIIEFIKGTSKNSQYQIVSSYRFSIVMNLSAITIS